MKYSRKNSSSELKGSVKHLCHLDVTEMCFHNKDLQTDNVVMWQIDDNVNRKNQKLKVLIASYKIFHKKL